MASVPVSSLLNSAPTRFRLSSLRSARRAVATIDLAAGVSAASRLPWRTKIGTPSSSSSCRICLLMPGCDVNKRFGGVRHVEAVVDDRRRDSGAAGDSLRPRYNLALEYLANYIAAFAAFAGCAAHLVRRRWPSTFRIHPADPQPRLIRQAAAILRDGGVIAYPTDSSYAFGCHIGDAAAARRIRQIRGVDDKHHLTLVCRDLAEIGRYARLDNWQFRIVKQGMPGSLHVPAAGDARGAAAPASIRKRSTIGVRVPDHAVVQALAGRAGRAAACRRR